MARIDIDRGAGVFYLAHHYGFYSDNHTPVWFKKPNYDRESCEHRGEWLEPDNCHLVSLEKKNWPLFSSMLTEGQAKGNLVMDAHLAALSASCGATLATTDRDFSRFSGIKVINPMKK